MGEAYSRMGQTYRTVVGGKGSGEKIRIVRKKAG